MKTLAINTATFLKNNIKTYFGDSKFLSPATDRTKYIVRKLKDASDIESLAPGRVLKVYTDRPSKITAFPAGFIDKDREVIYGLQTPVLFGRAIKPFGGYKMIQMALSEIGVPEDPQVKKVFTEWCRTHNDGVFSIYTPEMKNARRAAILTGLPDGYGRGRIIGDYRRVPLYGVDALIADKKEFLNKTPLVMTISAMQLREEISMQIDSLKELKVMANEYGHDISKPAKTAKEAVQWLYYAYLAAVKVQDGAAMSIGRIDSFLDVYFERDNLPESEAQEIIDDFVLKLRSVRHLRPDAYNQLFSGDPTWVTLSLGGMLENGEPSVTKTTYRFLNTLNNCEYNPEPNMTILWDSDLPIGFKKFCTDLSIKSSSIQYENDRLMKTKFGDDYAISCCVSAMTTGKDMQFFGARANLAKLLLYSLNKGRDEISGEQVGPKFRLQKHELGQQLDIKEVVENYKTYMEWLAKLYAETMNVIHFSHDKYAYEAIQMALHDNEPRRLMAFGIAGLSVAVDSLSAIENAQVFPLFDERGIITDFEVIGDYPRYGNDNLDADKWAIWLTDTFISELRKHPLYREAEATLSVLTITSNVVYGKNTGTTPDGRLKGEPFSPGANSMHGRDNRGVIASMNSVAKISYESCLDGISNTLTLSPGGLGKTNEERISTLMGLLDGYFENKGHHVNINVFDKELLRKAQLHPENYPNLTIRVSGYAVNFHKLTKEQQNEVIMRTCH